MYFASAIIVIMVLVILMPINADLTLVSIIFTTVFICLIVNVFEEYDNISNIWQMDMVLVFLTDMFPKDQQQRIVCIMKHLDICDVMDDFLPIELGTIVFQYTTQCCDQL